MTVFINFKLKALDEILPFGDETNQSLHWFGLTDCYYWLDFGKAKIYEYSKEFLALHKEIQSGYVDYYFARLFEDLTEIFEFISEELPDDFYNRVKNQSDLATLWNKSRTWLLKKKNNILTFDKQMEYYEFAHDWIIRREITSGHLTQGPQIFFFRNKDQISIVWNTSFSTIDNIPIWSAHNGQIEMKYSDFIDQINIFGANFFSEMDNQVNNAINKNWGTIQVDKKS